MQLLNNKTWHQKAIDVLNENGAILMPTETVWGLGGNALSVEVINKIRLIKNRPEHKTFIVLVANIDMLFNYVNELPNEIEKFLNNTDRPTTVIYSNPKNLPEELLAEDGSIAIRIAGVEWLAQFIEQFGQPIISTSANISGEPTAATFQQVSTTIKERVDYIIPFQQNDVTEKQSSQIIKLENKEIIFLRK